MNALLTRIKNEPALIAGVLLAIFNLFAVDPEISSSIITIVSAVLPLILAVAVRQNVTGPETGRVLAEQVTRTHNQTLKDPDRAVESVAPSVKAVRAAQRVLK